MTKKPSVAGYPPMEDIMQIVKSNGLEYLVLQKKIGEFECIDENGNKKIIPLTECITVYQDYCK